VQQFVLAELERRERAGRRMWTSLPTLVSGWVDAQTELQFVNGKFRGNFKKPSPAVADATVRRAVHRLERYDPPLVELDVATSGRRRLLVRRSRHAVLLGRRIPNI
jgi:hypothetical protein